MIEQVRNEFIKISDEYLKKEGYDYWNEHVKYVVEKALLLAELYEADVELVEISAILHDVSKPLEERENESHNIVSADISGKILNNLEYDPIKIEKIKECIKTHSGPVTDTLTKEQWCVRNADALSLLNNISILYYLAYKEYKLNYVEGKKFVKDMINNKLLNLDKEIYEKYKNDFNLILESI